MTFKRASVVLLPNYKSINILKGDIDLFDNKLSIQHKDLTDNSSANPIRRASSIKHHIYITSDEEIKEGDYCIEDIGGMVFGPYEKGDTVKNPKVIIASTHSSLGLPKPSNSFIQKYIEQYNVGNVITDVLVEYLEGHIAICKVSKNNTITIRRVKDSWTGEELLGNGEDSFDNYLLHNASVSQEEREVILDNLYNYINQ